MLLNAVIVCGIITVGFGDVIFECPDEWQPFAEKCYKFAFYPSLTYEEAKMDCGIHGASLVGVNLHAEHVFISNWLLMNDLSRGTWFTSGIVNNMNTGDLVWESDATVILPDRQYWLNEEHKNMTGRNIVYMYGVTQYGWSRVQGDSSQSSYVCEIHLDEAYRIVQEERDFDYGTNITDPNDVPRGPRLMTEPYDLVEIGDAVTASIECVATAVPPPIYRMYHTLQNVTILITPDLDDRYSLTNGKVTIADPREDPDGGRYHCEAENEFGIVVSKQMQLSFGNLAEFSNIGREPVRAVRHSYAIINCVPPLGKPAVAYNWLKSSGSNFIRTDINPHIFISYNGKLYFSEVTDTDETYYRCVVKLISDSSAVIGSHQPPSRLSMPIDLQLIDDLSTDWGPEIANDFVASFPRLPKRGQRVRLECLAYGTMPIAYSWQREGGLPMPLSTVLDDHNRILYIDNVQLEDAGNYTCHAKRGSSGSDQKSFYLKVEAIPYFIYPLRDQHADINSKLTWRCDARAVPNPTYRWLKNGQPLNSVPGDVTISGNILTINSLDPQRHSDMYQCSATNIHGVAYSSGQLRVLAFAPSFVKHPLEPTIMGSVGGNVTIICNPEAAPFPTYNWAKDGSDLNLPDGDSTSRVRKLKNGNLFISPGQLSDSGRYDCTAQNVYGSATSSGQLTVITGLTITNAPSPTQVVVNNTAFLMCQASHQEDVEMVYDWHFQGKPVNFNDPHFELGLQGTFNGLYIIGAQARFGGEYECLAKTAFERVSREATLTVLGPPGEPSGVFVESVLTTHHSMVLWWTTGSENGRNIISYAVEVSTNFDPSWILQVGNIPDRATIVQGRNKRRYEVGGLKPGTGYQFRIKATNFFGVGPHSSASDVFQTPTAPPALPPEKVGGGGGSVGDLTITWEPLQTGDHGGPGFSYIVYWRPQGTDRWATANVGAEETKYVETVGQALFYSLYEVKVQGINEKGQGPNSSVSVIYSAEDMPVGVPGNIYAFQHNATAINVTWSMVPNTREVMKGKVFGYNINYQTMEEEPFANTLGLIGQISSGLVIGLEPYSWYIFDVQVVNTGGMGPVSEVYRQSTWGYPPQLYPTEVYIFSHGPDSVRVSWRGISTTTYEEPLIGYKVRHWAATDDIRTARDTKAGKTSEVVIYGVSANFLYRLRVFGYSRGGDGKMSPDVYFTLGGSVRIDSDTSEIRAAATTTHASLTTLMCCATTLVLNTLLAPSTPC
ncbi:contactin-like [Haliotis cracherodii]|uniref:contactin-like n=1 Tax=Haliotis cracherodii TaxID=6455 RepID=UPI0039EC1178